MILPIAGLMFTSCLDFDVTGAEFSQTQENEEKVIRRGPVDDIKYDVEITEAELDEALNATSKNLGVAMAGVYAMRGGKEGAPPVTHQYQYQYALGVDQYAQYGVIPHVNFPYSGINLKSSYAIDEKCYGGAYGSFLTVAKNFIPLLNMEEIDQMPEIKAAFLLLYDYAAIEVADVYGPFPYQDIKTNKQERPFIYDGVEEIYLAVEQNIKSIVDCFNHFEGNRDAGYKQKVLKTLSDRIPINLVCQEAGYQSLDYFIRFANSLKLRMAMHIVKKDADRAKKWAEEAVKGGVIEATEQEMALYPTVSGFTNPMLQLWNEWNDMRMSAGFEQVLRAFNHPFLEMIFAKNERIVNQSDPSLTLEANQKVCGILSGAHVGQEQGNPNNPYNGFSKLNQKCISEAPLYLMKLSEVCFLRAEGKIRGWDMMGDAKDFYEQGIAAGDVQDRIVQKKPYRGMYEKALPAYMEQDKATPFTYVDPTGNDPDQVSQIVIGVKWDDNDTKEVKLEKIITQKYIAGFPNSFEAWVDLRRTGYPRLFKVLNPGDGDGSLKYGDIIRRLPFPDKNDPAVMKDITDTGMKVLFGEDLQSTRLWWDPEKDNF